MKKIILYFFLTLSFLSCKEKQTDKILFVQPNIISLDTTLNFFPVIKKYIREVNSVDKNVNKFILSISYYNEYIQLKISAIKTPEAFNFQFPNYYFKYKENLILVFTGIDKISKIDSTYIRSINDKFVNNDVSIYDPECWEILFNEDTCYYFRSTCPLIPVVNSMHFQVPDEFQSKE